MGKQAKLKALRRTARASKQFDEDNNKQEEETQSPPDLGVKVEENIKSEEVFGRP